MATLSHQWYKKILERIAIHTYNDQGIESILACSELLGRVGHSPQYTGIHHFHTSLQREEKMYKCHMALRSMLRNEKWRHIFPT